LSNENDSLRKSNILLEEKCTALEFGELPIAASSKRRATNSDPNDLSCGIEARALGHGNVNSLRTKLRNVSRENVSLKSENEVIVIPFFGVLLCRSI
jgi:hypothetical protein